MSAIKNIVIGLFAIIGLVIVLIVGCSDDCLALGGALAFAKMDLDEYKAWKAKQGK